MNEQLYTIKADNYAGVATVRIVQVNTINPKRVIVQSEEYAFIDCIDSPILLGDVWLGREKITNRAALTATAPVDVTEMQARFTELEASLPDIDDPATFEQVASELTALQIAIDKANGRMDDYAEARNQVTKFHTPL